jgi:hypothetical protein
LAFRSRRLVRPTINHSNHKAGIVIGAGGEIGQLLPLHLQLGLEGKPQPKMKT